MRLGKRKGLGTDRLGRLLDHYEQAKARLRAKVERPFHVVKNLFHYGKLSIRVERDASAL